MKIAFACLAFALAGAMEEMEGPRIVLRIGGDPGSVGGMFAPTESPFDDMQAIQKAFSSASSILDDFGHESVFDEIFPKTHRKQDIFPAFRQMDNSGGSMGGFINGIMNMMSGMVSHRRHQPRLINLMAPPTVTEQQEQQEGHCCCKDMREHCSAIEHHGTVAGVFAMTKCLARRKRDHHDVTPACAEKLAETVAGACLGDIEKHCPAVEPGKSMVHTCLYKNRATLSRSCRKYMHVTTDQVPAATPTAKQAPRPVSPPPAKRVMHLHLKAPAAAVENKVIKTSEITLPAPPTHRGAKLPPSVTMRMKAAEESLATAKEGGSLKLAPGASANAAAGQNHAGKNRGLWIALSCTGVVAVAAAIVAAVVRTRRPSGDQSHYSAMLI